jgi:hypothetical protein
MFRFKPWRLVVLFGGAFLSIGVAVGVPVGIGFRASGDEVWIVLGAALAFAAVWLWGIFRVGVWAAQIAPPDGLVSVSAGELRKRILALNDLDLPFHVREDKQGRLIAEWKLADARWTGLFESGRLTIAHRVRLRIDERRRQVRAIDFQKRIEWRGGVARSGWSGRFQFFRGIVFMNYQAGAEYGLLFTDGRWQFARAYRYSFNVEEMKQPLVQAVVLSGWTWQPVAFR